MWAAVTILVRFLPMSVSLLGVRPLQQISPSQRILKPVNVGVPLDTLDGSDQPCFLIWPLRTDNNNFWLLDAHFGRHFELNDKSSLTTLGVAHFYDAFGLHDKRDFLREAVKAFGFDPADVQQDWTVEKKAAAGLDPEY